MSRARASNSSPNSCVIGAAVKSNDDAVEDRGGVWTCMCTYIVSAFSFSRSRPPPSPPVSQPVRPLTPPPTPPPRCPLEIPLWRGSKPQSQDAPRNSISWKPLALGRKLSGNQCSSTANSGRNQPSSTQNLLERCLLLTVLTTEL